MLTFAKTSQGSIISVDELAAVPRQQHPEFFCHGCDGRLTVKLGSHVAHHFAHKPDADCYAASSGEGARHLAAKLHLERELRALVTSGGAEVHAVVNCVSCSAALSPSLVCQVGAGDEVLVEKQLSDFVPDVQLRSDVGVKAVFEVLWSHRCHDEKWRRLRDESRASVVECRAEALLDDETNHRWSPARPLTTIRAIRVVAKDVCNACDIEIRRQREDELSRVRREQEEARQAAERAARRRDVAERRRIARRRTEIESEWRRWNATQRGVLAMCDADQLLPDGRRFRHRLLLIRTVLRGQWQSAELHADGSSIRTWSPDGAGDATRLLAEAKATAQQWARSRGASTWDTHGGLIEPRARITADRDRSYGDDDFDKDFGDEYDDDDDDTELEFDGDNNKAAATEIDATAEPWPSFDYGMDERTVAALKHPFPNLWWLESENRWLRCYRFDELEDFFGGLANRWTINRWATDGKIKMLEVQASRTGRKVRMADADHLDGFLNWLRRKTHRRGLRR